LPSTSDSPDKASIGSQNRHLAIEGLKNVDVPSGALREVANAGERQHRVIEGSKLKTLRDSPEGQVTEQRPV